MYFPIWSYLWFFNFFNSFRVKQKSSVPFIVLIDNKTNLIWIKIWCFPPKMNIQCTYKLFNIHIWHIYTFYIQYRTDIDIRILLPLYQEHVLSYNRSTLNPRIKNISHACGISLMSLSPPPPSFIHTDMNFSISFQ